MLALALNFNALYTADSGLDAFLDSKQGSDWSGTQTVAPLNVQVTGVTENSVTLVWDPIEYTAHTGRYRVQYGTMPGGPYSEGGTIASKSASGLLVEAVPTGTTLYFVVQTETDSHSNNSNDLVSEMSTEVTGTTLAGPSDAIFLDGFEQP